MTHKYNDHIIDDIEGLTQGWEERNKKEVYNYFPPPLKPLDLSSIKGTVFSISDTRKRYKDEFGLNFNETTILLQQGADVMSFFEEIAHTCGDPRLAFNWMTQVILPDVKNGKLKWVQRQINKN